MQSTLSICCSSFTACKFCSSDFCFSSSSVSMLSVLPRAAEVPAVKGKQSELAGRHRPLRIVKAEKSRSDCRDRRPAPRSQSGCSAPSGARTPLGISVFTSSILGMTIVSPRPNTLEPVRHIRGNDLRQVVDLRRDAVRAPLKGVAIGLRRPLQPLEEEHAVRTAWPRRSDPAGDKPIRPSPSLLHVRSMRASWSMIARLYSAALFALRSRADVLLASCACLLCSVYTRHKYAKLVIVCLL